MNIRRLLVLLCTVALTATGLAACGAGDPGATGSTASAGSAQDLRPADLRGGEGDRTAASSTPCCAPTCNGLPMLSGPVALKVSGPFASRGAGQVPSFDLALALALGGQTLSAGAVSTGDKGYLRFQGEAYAVDDASWAKVAKAFTGASKRPGGSLQALGIDPLTWLADPKVAGQEDVAGVPTTKISSPVAVGALLDDLARLLGKAGGVTGGTAGVPARLSPAARKAIQDAVTSATVDLWTGTQDHLLRRAAVRIAFDVPQDQRAKAGGLSSGTVALDLTLTDLNQPQTITPPANAKPLSGLTGLLHGLLGK